MFDKPYAYQKVTQQECVGPEPVNKIYYRFKTPHRKYFVTIEVFPFRMAAIKYCDLKDKGARNAYKKIFNDGDAFRVITTCLYIMRDYWRENPAISFAFYAMPRDAENILPANKNLSPEEQQTFI